MLDKVFGILSFRTITQREAVSGTAVVFHFLMKQHRCNQQLFHQKDILHKAKFTILALPTEAKLVGVLISFCCSRGLAYKQ